MAEKLQKPTRNYLFILMIMNGYEIVATFTVSKVYFDPIYNEIYYIYQSQYQRQIIDFVYKISMV